MIPKIKYDRNVLKSSYKVSLYFKFLDTFHTTMYLTLLDWHIYTFFIEIIEFHFILTQKTKNQELRKKYFKILFFLKKFKDSYFIELILRKMLTFNLYNFINLMIFNIFLLVSRKIRCYLILHYYFTIIIIISWSHFLIT